MPPIIPPIPPRPRRAPRHRGSVRGLCRDERFFLVAAGGPGVIRFGFVRRFRAGRRFEEPDHRDLLGRDQVLAQVTVNHDGPELDAAEEGLPSLHFDPGGS